MKASLIIASTREVWSGFMSEETKAIEETAKAAQELAKTSSKAIDATREVGGWLDRVFGEAVEHTVGRLWTDRMMASRIEASIYNYARLTTLLHNTEKKLQKKGVTTTRVVPPKIALPLLEHATMEHEDDLHELWENLLTSALDPSEEEIKRMYVSVLSELSAKEAHALKRLYAEWRYWNEREVPDFNKKEHRYSSGIGTENDESAVLFYRLGLILPVHVTVEEYRNRSDVYHNNWRHHESSHMEGGSSYVEGGEKMLVLGDLSVVGLTEFGEKFCNAVIGDVSGLYEPPEPRTFENAP
jgi:hypothetical protein